MDVEDRDLTSDGLRRHAEALAAHRGFVRALARGLTAPSSVEDVAQEVLLAGLQSPPRNSGALRGWLATAVRNVACKLRRSETRRATRETAAAAREAMPSTRELVERIELAQTVVRAVVSLREPERTAVLWRFYEGRTTAEIGARLGVPADTVRARLRRGLEEVRRNLDGTCGGRDAWLAALLPLAGLETAAAAISGGGGVVATGVAKASFAKAAAATGVVTMAVKTWTAVAVASASAVLAWWLAPAGFFEEAFTSRPAVVAERSSSAAADLPESALLAGNGSALPLPAERALVDSLPSPAEILANAAVALPPPGQVLVRVLDARTGSPLESVRIRFLHEKRFAEYSGHGVVHASLTSGSWEASVTATGYEPAGLQSFEVVSGATTELGAVALTKGVGVIEGRVVARHLPGEAAVKVQLHGDGRSPCGSETEPASCGCGFQEGFNELDLAGDRRFRFGHLGAGVYWLRAFDPTQGIADARRIEVARGGAAWQELDVTPPTIARLELRHDRSQGGGLFTGDWSSVHQESPSPIRFTFRRDGKIVGETEYAPNPDDVRSTIGGPLLPLPGKETAATSSDGPWRLEAGQVYLDLQLVTSFQFALHEGFLNGLGESADERLDRERQEGDSLEFDCAEPDIRVALLIERLRADAFEVRPLPRQLLTVVVSSDHYASQELPLDLTFDRGLSLVVTMFPTEAWSKELAAIAQGPPASCAACHDGEPSPSPPAVSMRTFDEIILSNPGEARFELNLQPILRSGE